MKASDDGFKVAVVPSGASAAETGRNGIGAPVSDEGAPPSNTAPSNHGFTLLRFGIDSSYLSFPGNIDEAIESIVKSAKASAASPDIQEQAKALINIMGHSFAVLDRGAGKFAYVLVDDFYKIQLSSSSASRLPLAYVQVSSKCHNTMTLSQIYQELRHLISWLGKIEDFEGNPAEASVSRLDRYGDVATRFLIGVFNEASFVGRARKFARYSEGAVCTGFVYGQGGKISARLYDKTYEITKSNKEYMKELWMSQGWDGITPVTRLEFQVMGEALKELLPNRNPFAIDADKARLWAYLTNDWLRIVTPGDHMDKDRHLTHPLWQFMTAAFGATTKFDRLKKDLTKRPSLSWILKLWVNLIAVYMAAEGFNEPERASNEMWRKAESYFFRFSSQGDLKDYLKDKAQLKRREYYINTGEFL